MLFTPEYSGRAGGGKGGGVRAGLKLKKMKNVGANAKQEIGSRGAGGLHSARKALISASLSGEMLRGNPMSTGLNNNNYLNLKNGTGAGQNSSIKRRGAAGR